MIEFILSNGIITSIIASIILIVITVIIKWYKGMPGARLATRFCFEFSKSGGINFFESRKSYIKFKDHGTSSEYVLQAKKSVCYVGYWLSLDLNEGDLISAITSLVNEDCKVTIVLMNPCSEILIQSISNYLNMSPTEVKSRTIFSIDRLHKLYETLYVDQKARFDLRVHNIPLSFSAFLIDHKVSKKGRVLFDFKLFSHVLSDGFGLEFRNNGGSLYGRLSSSAENIAKESEPLSSDLISYVAAHVS